MGDMVATVIVAETTAEQAADLPRDARRTDRRHTGTSGNGLERGRIGQVQDMRRHRAIGCVSKRK